MTALPLGPTALDLRDVFKIYRDGETDSETVALRGVDLTLRRGEIVALIGRSGAGKSTLLTIIGGMDTCSAGRVLVNGQDMGRLDDAARAAVRRRDLGFMFQEHNLLPYLSARENVILAGAIADPEKWQSDCRQHADLLLSKVGLDGRTTHRPHQLSGGERQRVGVACALAGSPSILLADEITGELDSTTAEQVMTLVITLSRQDSIAVLLVTHNLEVARRADRILQIVDGLLRPVSEGEQ